MREEAAAKDDSLRLARSWVRGPGASCTGYKLVHLDLTPIALINAYSDSDNFMTTTTERRII